MWHSILLLFLFLQEQVYACQRSATTVSGHLAPKQFCSGDIIFEDHFKHLDTKRWKHEQTLSGGGNWEFQWYTDDNKNSFIQNKHLYIKPTLTSDFIGENALFSETVDLGNKCTDSRDWGCTRVGTSTNIINPVRSAKLTTKDSFAFKYGRVEVRAKIPTGDWLWPAIWMLPKQDKYGGWPMSGEINIMESRGNENLNLNNQNIGVEQVRQTLHWGPDPGRDLWQKTFFSKNRHDYRKDFRNYDLTWTPDHIQFTIDGEIIGTVNPGSSFWNFGNFGPGVRNPWGNSKMAPFDQEFYIILNLAVGGTNGYFPDNAWNPTTKPWSNQSPKAYTDFWNNRSNWLSTWNLQNIEHASFQIDHVKVWAL